MPPRGRRRPGGMGNYWLSNYHYETWKSDFEDHFIVIPQNGIELVTLNGEEGGAPATLYLSNIDAVGQEDLFYGYTSDNQRSPEEESSYLMSFLNVV